MDLLTVREVGELWGITARMVTIYCERGRILGAIKKGNLWLIPKDANKPADRRKKAKYSKRKSIVNVEEHMMIIKRFEKEDIEKVISFELELRHQEPDTYYWDPDEKYVKQLKQSFDDPRFNTALSFIALKGNNVIGRIDASLISSRSDASCFSAYLDWICVLKSERHNQVAQALLNALRNECKEQGVGLLIALMANNDEAQRFYKNVEGASIHDTGIWIDIK